MASIFKQQYYGIDKKTGNKIKKKSKCWYVEYKTAEGICKRIKGYQDKQATKQLVARLERDAELAQEGIVDRFKEHSKQPLLQHLEDFESSLASGESSRKHAEQQRKRVQRVFAKSGFSFFSDISASRLQRTISTLKKEVRKKDDKGKVRLVEAKEIIADKTKNYHLQACKQFCLWAIDDQRVGDNPIAHLKPVKAASQKRLALSADEISFLLQATESAQKSYKIEGRNRALLYRFAVETGFRASEIRALIVKDFDLVNRLVRLSGKYTKNNKDAVLPLKPETCDFLKESFKTKTPKTEAFAMPHPCSVVRMFRKDLDHARKIWLNQAANNPAELKQRQDSDFLRVERDGVKLDFHSLRHTFGTLLAASGIHPKTAQQLMRHSNINLTMSRYTHILSGQEASAIESLPDFSKSDNSNSQKATGTDGKTCESDKFPYRPAYRKLTGNGYNGCHRSSLDVSREKDSPENNSIHKASKYGTLDTECLPKSSGDTKRIEWAEADLNRRHTDFQSVALPTELPARTVWSKQGN